MAPRPRALRILKCLNINVHVPLPADGSAKNRPWTGEIKQKILASARRERVSAVRTEEGEPCDANGVQKQSVPDRKVVEQRQATTAQGLRSALKRESSFHRDNGAPESIAVAAAGNRERKGIRVRFDLPAAEETIAAPVVEPPPPLFPTGLLGEPPESFAHSGPEMTAAFLMSVTGAGAGSATPIDSELVARWTERREASSRRLRYLRDYCPFQREDDYEEDEESTPETMTTLPAPAEPDHAEVVAPPPPSPESEAEFAKAIRSRYLLKDDFISRYYGAVVPMN